MNQIKRELYNRKWQQDNSEKVNTAHRKWRKDNPDKVKEWKENNLDRLRETQRKSDMKIRTTPKGKLDNNLGSAICRVLNGVKSGRHWETLVNYTVEDLIKHLEQLFDEKMTWDNYGSYWDVDHIKPKSLFHYETTDDEEFKQCWALKNLQPLEHIANIKKFNHYLI